MGCSHGPLFIRFAAVLHRNSGVDAGFSTGGMSGVILYRRSLSGQIRVQNVAEPSYEDAADGWVRPASSDRIGLYGFLPLFRIVCILKASWLV